MPATKRESTRIVLPATVTRSLIVLLLTAIYALCFAVIKAGLPYAPPLRFAGLRALIGGGALLGLIVALRRPLFPPTRSWPWIGAVALTATTISFGAMFLSPGRMGAGIASVLGNTQPVVVPALAALFLSERITRGKWAALVLGMAGVILIALPALAGADAFGVAGAGLALAASGGLAVSNIVVKRMQPQIDVLALAGWQLVAGSLPLLAASVAIEGDAPVVWNAMFVSLLLFLALIGTALATAVWYWLIRHDDLGRLTMFFFLIPIFGLGIAAFLFSEGISWIEGVGVMVTLAGIGAIALEEWHIKRASPQGAACSHCGRAGVHSPSPCEAERAGPDRTSTCSCPSGP
jgi:drug/metabolite transporter (DMT)-like permease